MFPLSWPTKLHASCCPKPVPPMVPDALALRYVSIGVWGLFINDIQFCQAIPLAIFLLLEKDVEEAQDDRVTALFVEACGDRQTFFNVCVTEIEKAELIIEKHLARRKVVTEPDTSIDGEESEALEVPDLQEDKIQILLDLFKDKGLVTLTKYMKVFNLHGNSQVLGIAHTKLNADYEKVFKKLKIIPDDDNLKHVKSFTRPSEEQMSGKNTMVATVCKIFHLKNFSRDFRGMVLKIFNMDAVESDGEKESNGHLAASQDYPDHSQSRTNKTLRICSCCKFKTRDNDAFENHMNLHSKCIHCGLNFGDEEGLAVHFKAFHAVKECEKCGKEILEINMKKHLNGHAIQKGFKMVVSKGKVRVKGKDKDESEEKVSKLTGYRLFQKSKRPEIRDKYPDASPQEIIRLLNEAWNIEKASAKKTTVG